MLCHPIQHGRGRQEKQIVRFDAYLDYDKADFASFASCLVERRDLLSPCLSGISVMSLRPSTCALVHHWSFESCLVQVKAKWLAETVRFALVMEAKEQAQSSNSTKCRNLIADLKEKVHEQQLANLDFVSHSFSSFAFRLRATVGSVF